jgi:hypothetical protein
MGNEQTKGKKVIKAIIENYRETEKSLVAQLNFEVPNHSPTIGSFREEIWKQLFEQIVPKKYVIEQSVFLLDSSGNVSDEVDLAILDEMYTPYIFRKDRIKFIPIEAVAAVVQCKSTNVDNKDNNTGEYYLRTWCKSIKNLNTSSDSITRMVRDITIGPAKTQSGTRPIKILCALSKPTVDLMNCFDIYIIANNNSQKIEIIVPHETDWDLGQWHYELNMRDNKSNSKFIQKKLNRKLSDYRVVHNGQLMSILTLNLQFNQLLMLINNPMLFPHKAYVEMFNNVEKENKDDGKNTD